MLKRILKEVKEFKMVSFLTPLFMVLEVIFEVLIPQYMGKIIDLSEADKVDMDRVLMYGGIMLLLAGGAL